MTEYSNDGSQWWRVEPPNYDDEPGEDYSFLAKSYYPAPGEDGELDVLVHREYLDGTLPHPLFENVRVIEQDNALYFEVPPRYIDTPAHGKWILRVLGKRDWFKERDDFGEIRFTQNAALWIPHLYPFEETDAAGMPRIRDRERCEVTIMMQPLNPDTDLALETTLHTPSGVLEATESPESYNPEGIRVFREFTRQDMTLNFEQVTYQPRQWDSIDHFLADRQIDLTPVEYVQVRSGELTLPELSEYFNQNQPNEWRERQASGYTGKTFGKIWVPIDELRRGVDADILFPLFTS